MLKHRTQKLKLLEMISILVNFVLNTSSQLQLGFDFSLKAQDKNFTWLDDGETWTNELRLQYHVEPPHLKA